MWFETCDVCTIRAGWLGCFGHRACVLHAAEVRAETYKFDAPDLPGSDVSPLRLTGVTRP